MITKKTANNIHFKKRILQRYKLLITNADIDKMVKIVTNGGAKILEKCPGARRIYEVVYMEKIITVVYDRNQKNFVTALPRKKQKLPPENPSAVNVN